MKPDNFQKNKPAFRWFLFLTGIWFFISTSSTFAKTVRTEGAGTPSLNRQANQPTELADGTYRIKIVGSGKYLHERGNGDKFVSTRDQIDDNFSKFTVKKNSDNSYIIRVLANNRHLHVDISTDSKLSTRFQPGEKDVCSRFELEAMTDGSYRIKVQCANKFVLREDDKQFISATSNATDKMTHFLFSLVPNEEFPEGETQSENGLIGHMEMRIDRSGRTGDGYGVGFYVSIFPMMTTPLQNFQVGLPSTWLNPENDSFGKLLCPPETYAGKNWHHLWPDKFREHFQTIEGGTGYWVSTQFPTSMPKYRINGTPNCYSGEISSPGWGFTSTTPLKSNEMGIAQLSNRMLLPPDGLTFATNTNGELLGSAWMALPFTNRKGFYRLQAASMSEDQCLQGNEGTVAASRAPISNSKNDTQLYQIQDMFDGYVRFTHPGQNSALEGNQVVTGATAGGAALMLSGNADGQKWKLKPVEGDYYQLVSKFLESKNKCLELDDRTGKAFMKDCQANPTPQQKWKLTGVAHQGVTPTGDKSWTLFLNSANFKGPLAFWIPDTWSKVTIGHDSLAGRGLDARLAVVNAASMEIGRVPYFMKKTATGEVYTKIPPLKFPVNAANETPFMARLSYFASDALYSKVKKWFEGGEKASGSFTGAIGPNIRVTPFSLRQSSRKIPIDVSSVVSLAKQDGFFSSFGFKWENGPDKGNFPQYFKKSFDKMVAVPETSVPDNLGLKTQNFRAKSPGTPFDVTLPSVANNPEYSAYGFPIPNSALETVTLNDGTRVTYTWYRFVDQPSLKQYNLTTAEKNQLQQRVEKIHREWRIDGTYMQNPSNSKGTKTTLVSFDQALFVTPPPGKEIGFVPIVLKQEKR